MLTTLPQCNFGPRNTQQKSHTLSLKKYIFVFQNDALWDILEHVKLRGYEEKMVFHEHVSKRAETLFHIIKLQS